MAELNRIESPEQKRRLLQIARDTAGDCLGLPPINRGDEFRIEGTFGGAFVTFRAGTQLRGCIGSFARTSDVVETIRGVTCRSLKDQRFAANPITLAELNDLEIEISVLSDLDPTDDPLSLKVGVHGILVRRGAKSGCFLPKVAVEQGWTAEEFLSTCCSMKAKLSAGAWREAGTETALFTADVFSE